jgi:hypothetical protein
LVSGNILAGTARNVAVVVMSAAGIVVAPWGKLQRPQGRVRGYRQRELSAKRISETLMPAKENGRNQSSGQV